MEVKLFDSELKVMGVLWRGGCYSQAYCGSAEGRSRLEQEHDIYAD